MKKDTKEEIEPLCASRKKERVDVGNMFKMVTDYIGTARGVPRTSPARGGIFQ